MAPWVRVLAAHVWLPSIHVRTARYAFPARMPRTGRVGRSLERRTGGRKGLLGLHNCKPSGEGRGTVGSK